MCATSRPHHRVTQFNSQGYLDHGGVCVRPRARRGAIMLHAKAVPAEGRRAEGPIAMPAVCATYSGGEGTLEITSEVGKIVTFKQSQLWHWAMSSNQQPRRVTGDAVPMAPGDLCIALIPENGELQSVQAVPRLTGRISSRPSAAVGQIEPDDDSKPIASANVFLRLSQVAGASQLPAVGERVQFQLAPNPERADRLWASEVIALEDNSLASKPVGRSAAASEGGAGADPPGGPVMGSAATAGGPTATEPPAKRTFEPGCRVYVGRFPPEATWQQLHDLFAPLGTLVHVQIPLDENGRRRGFAVVELERAEAASSAVQK